MSLSSSDCHGVESVGNPLHSAAGALGRMRPTYGSAADALTVPLAVDLGPVLLPALSAIDPVRAALDLADTVRESVERQLAELERDRVARDELRAGFRGLQCVMSRARM